MLRLHFFILNVHAFSFERRVEMFQCTVQQFVLPTGFVSCRTSEMPLKTYKCKESSQLLEWRIDFSSESPRIRAPALACDTADSQNSTWCNMDGGMCVVALCDFFS